MCPVTYGGFTHVPAAAASTAVATFVSDNQPELWQNNPCGTNVKNALNEFRITMAFNCHQLQGAAKNSPQSFLQYSQQPLGILSKIFTDLYTVMFDI